MSNFDVIHNISNDYFYTYVSEKRSFSHYVDVKKANFFLYFNMVDRLEYFCELERLNSLQNEWEFEGFSEFKHFGLLKADTYLNYDFVLTFVITEL